jgi:hypothetical protein
MLAISGALAFIYVIGRALPDPLYLSSEVSNIDQSVFALLGSDMARAAVAFVGLASVVVGLLLYLKLTGNAVNEDETELSITRRFVLLVILWDLIPASLYGIIFFSPLQVAFGRFFLDVFLCLFYGIALAVGLGFVSDHFNFDSKARATHSRVHMYVLRKGAPPSIVVDATDLIGGYLYMFLDNRVVKAEMRIVQIPYTQKT